MTSRPGEQHAGAQRAGRLDAELDRLRRIPLLVCDEVGYRWLAAVGLVRGRGEMRLPYGLLARLLAGAAPDWSAGLDPAGSKQLEAADPVMVGAELVQLFGDLQESGPVALIVDDAARADPLSLRALTFALRRLQADRVLTVLTLRPEESPAPATGPGQARPGPRCAVAVGRAEHRGGA